MNSEVHSIWHLAAIQLLKDCGQEVHYEAIERVTQQDDLMQLATWVIGKLLRSGGHELTAALYRLDIPEQKIRQMTQSVSVDERLTAVAKAAVDRCIQKVQFRRLYSDLSRND